MDHKIYIGSNLDVLPSIADNSIDSIVTDPPYEIGFMCNSWDSSGIAYNVELWKHCLRVLKPGGHMIAFSGSRTYHRMTCAIEDAGFEIRDQIMWVYGSGFPKSLNIGKALDKAARVEREVVGEKLSPDGVPYSKRVKDGRGPKYGDSTYGNYGMNHFETAPATEAAKKWDGWGTALKPAHEPICLARKPISGTVADNVIKWGTGIINIDGCRVDNNGEQFGDLPNRGGRRVFNTNGKTFKEAGFDYKDGDLNADAVEKLKRIGRYPANFIHDGSQEVLELFPETGPSKASKRGARPHYNGQVMKDLAERGHDDNGGSAARFFYCPKASKKDRDEGCENMEERRESDREKSDGIGGNNPRNRTNEPRKNFHPTVKPTELMSYLCKLVTPIKGTILDPFMGSGSTGKSAMLCGFNFVGIEISDEYVKIAENRINAAKDKGDAK